MGVKGKGGGEWEGREGRGRAKRGRGKNGEGRDYTGLTCKPKNPLLGLHGQGPHMAHGKRKKKEEKGKKRRPRASNGQRYPLPCCTHFGNLKCAQQGKGYC